MKQNPRGTVTLVRHATVIIASLALSVPVLQSQSSAAATKKIDPVAVDALRRMGANLRTMKSFAVKVTGAKDEVMADGQKIQLSGTVKYVVRSPDRFRADIQTDRKQRTILYDGRTLTLYAPRMHYYATVDAPPTVGEMLDVVREKYGVELPVADLFLWGTERDGVKELTAARYVGPATIEGALTDHYAFRQKDTDWQIWIERGSNPLPRKLVITTTNEPSQPQYAATIAWNLAASTEDGIFAFVPPKDAAKIAWSSSTMLASVRPGN
ncbi:MAG TPA: DUF2092 domain-containing protein [Gemmatimonadaceae bacterium]|nr:DUF2092 domain-containing protein [Gemmatimonadaceae bacterium]